MAPCLAQALAAAPNGHASARQEATGVSAVAAVDDPRVRYLMALWKELLDADVAPGDNFFDAGGHSMLAVQMTDRVYRERGVRLNMMRLASWTLSQLAAELPASTDESSRRPAAAHGAPDGRQPASTSGLARMLGSPEAASQ